MDYVIFYSEELGFVTDLKYEEIGVNDWVDIINVAYDPHPNFIYTEPFLNSDLVENIASEIQCKYIRLSEDKLASNYEEEKQKNEI